MIFCDKSIYSDKRKIVRSEDKPAVLLRRAFEIATEMPAPFAAWRFPRDTGGHVILGRRIHQCPEPLNDDLPAFVAAPFGLDEPVQKIPAEAFVELKSGRVSCSKAFDKTLFTEQGSIPTADPGNGFSTKDRKRPCVPAESTKKGDFCRDVERAVAEIRTGKLDKVVLSRILAIPAPIDFSPVNFFERLCREYRNAFVSLVVLPGQGIWIGATPELLFEWQDDCIRTVSLAGTRRASSGSADGTWGEKERVEQQFVTDYIETIFSELDLGASVRRSERVLQIGDLQHLQTSFEICDKRLTDRVFSADVLRKLHPTPAVCGLPRGRALDFISRTERHARELYTGFLGPVNIDSQARFFVNLRCVQLLENQALFYAGCGITADSDPEQEWQESTQKSDALLRFFNVEPELLL